MAKFFRNLYQSKKSKARLGEINTTHGIIKTPAFVPVGTKGTIKALLPSLIKDIKIQIAFVNTYHLVTHPGAEIIEKAGGIHKFANLTIPLISDSGGFQVFSLGRNEKIKIRQCHSEPRLQRGKLREESNNKSNIIRSFAIAQDDKKEQNQIQILQDDGQRPERPMIEKISDDGVRFRSVFDGQLIEFTPEKSMEYQKMIGADINMAFDECTYYPATYKYAEKATRRTHKWLERCIQHRSRYRVFSSASPPKGGSPKRLTQKQVSSTEVKLQHQPTNEQYLYGVIQGATFEDLRRQSAEFVVNQGVDGVAIGGVSVGETKKEMREQVGWVADYLPKDKPVHLLGVGQIDDIIDLVKFGIDTFDCVEPTRLARMGIIYQTGNARYRYKVSSLSENIDILRGQYRYDLSKVDEGCNCYVCVNFTKAYLHHLFKQREILGYNLATYHNLWVMERLMEEIRQKIGEDKI